MGLEFRVVGYRVRVSSLVGLSSIRVHVGGCQNYGPFLGPYYNTAPNIKGTQKGDP